MKNFRSTYCPRRGFLLEGIPARVTDITGLSVSNGQLFKNNELLNTTPVRLALLQFIEFLKRAGGDSVVLIAHNGYRFVSFTS